MIGGAQAYRGGAGNRAGPYVIEVQGALEQHWEQELNMRLTHVATERGTLSVLSGPLSDQAMLLTVLGRLAMWGYLIVRVRFTPAGQPSAAEAPR